MFLSGAPFILFYVYGAICGGGVTLRQRTFLRKSGGAAVSMSEHRASVGEFVLPIGDSICSSNVDLGPMPDSHPSSTETTPTTIDLLDRGHQYYATIRSTWKDRLRPPLLEVVILD